MKGSEIRRSFLSFFKDRGHATPASFPLIPQGDPSLLFNSAGMVPFKSYFLGLKKDLARAATCQKCFRTTDIDRVGTTVRHLTFFEMLGNFSFGDYFKKDAVAWAWEFLTRAMALDPGKMHVTVFKEDEEALSLWKGLGVPNPVVRLGEDTNFWTMGPTGPCGPCSEIYWDRGREKGCGRPDCAPGCECDRFIEAWNLVFTQFDRKEDGSLVPLPRKNIDTGLGLERLAFLAQGAASPFETDLFSAVTDKARGILDLSRGDPERGERVLRVLGDHARAAAFLAAEGVIPSNEGRGYVLRRLIRRALSQGSRFQKKPGTFVHRLASEAAAMMGRDYPDLLKSRAEIEGTVRAEEEAFLSTLEAGEARLAQILAQKTKVLPGEEAFKLYDTYGFPLELTRERLGVEGIAVDEEGYRKAAEKAREVARQAWAGSGERAAHRFQGTLDRIGKTDFKGYDRIEDGARVLEVVRIARRSEGNRRIVVAETGSNPTLDAGQEGYVFLDRTPFYPEGGGQVGDLGSLSSEGLEAQVNDTFSPLKGLIAHQVKVLRGSLKAGLEVEARVDPAKRERSMCHHTATHLLNEALRRVFGTSVRQAGSYVGPDKLRFDYTLAKAPSPEELARIEALVNGAIQEGQRVCATARPASDAERFGAVALLGEEYGENPRFVWIGGKCFDEADPKNRFSLELCGGTHVRRTTEIRLFKILKDSSVSAGVRRIEAVAGPAAVEHLCGLEDRVRALARRLSVPPEELERKVEAMLRTEKELRQEVGGLKAKVLAGPSGDAGGTEVRDLPGGTRLKARLLEGADLKALRGLSDRTLQEPGTGAVFLACFAEGKVSFVLALSAELVGQGLDASRAAGALARAQGGKAGGRPEFAQGGGPGTKGFREMVDQLASLLKPE